ncbi:hypothetical protein CRYUN_Cryun22dG0056000 [Craigia yunnanensis]
MTEGKFNLPDDLLSSKPFDRPWTSKDQMASESSIPLSPQWLYVKPIETEVVNTRHMEDQRLEFFQFSFRWFNCLLIREILFHLVTRLWDTYLAEGDALLDFLVYVFANFFLTMRSALTSFMLM